MEKNINQQNANFWNELCGTGLAKSLSITEITPDSLARFDEAYLNIYPYLSEYINNENIKGKKVLEIGLGYGTLGKLLASCNCDYFGLDIAENPVEIMRYRLSLMDKNPDHVKVGSALNIPYENETFHYVYSIGCLHHTGDLAKSIQEVHRVLLPGGKAIIMLYNKNSFRQMIYIPLARLKSMLSLSKADKTYRNFSEFVRSLYDLNSQGQAAPHTDYVSKKQVYQIFKNFSEIGIDVQNFDTYVLGKGKIIIYREKLLDNLARIMGLDLYIIARK
ncbi:class I SAM-dependent methyltransferase [Sphaerospermopsis sp. LEGE 00249]|uniref:class I SAM-dependent methyltransferase n=1 Tax=Sphaerospermopsis sp. LEGE 00249 TaxID=1380707 RepID=UPI00164E80BE|nr:class I SAM-dependent methyltransferase [Sphaerospermopsis sp. LEGE 00249]MBC5793615.1 class I SAM-dependent methyltransferase [Sphaerospermopsis sp. LEGE 00249]